MAKKKENKVIDPPRYPKVINPMENDFKKRGEVMYKNLHRMLSITLAHNIKK